MPQPTPTGPGHAAPGTATTGAFGRDMLFVVGSKLLYLISRLAVPPLVLAHVTLADYGLWTTCFILVSYIGMSASGFAVVYVRYVADYHARQDTAAISRLLSTGIFAMGAFAMLAMTGLWLAMPGLLTLFKVTPAARNTASVLWLGACAVFLLDASVGAFGYVLHGLQRIRNEQQIWICSYLFETVCIVGFLQAGLGVYGLLAAFGLRYAFSIAAAAVLVKRALPGLRLGWRQFDRSCLRIFFGFGTWVQCGGLVGTFLQSVDRVLAGMLIGPAAAAVMELAGKLPSTGASLASSVSMVALPAAARQGALGASHAVLVVYRDAVRITAMLALLMLPPMACLAPLVIAAWLGQRADASALATIMAWVAIGTHLHILSGPASSVFRGLGRISNEYIYHGLRLATLATAVGMLLANGHGQATTALAAALGSAGLVAATAYLAISHRALTGGLAGLPRLYLLPFAAPYLLGLAVMRLAALWPLAPNAGRATALAHLLPIGLLYAALASAASWRWLLTPAERAACLRRLPARQVKNPAASPLPAFAHEAAYQGNPGDKQ
ncbi:lipopolysaccharide biosynthesis protein [Cupriavidus basilensis]